MMKNLFYTLLVVFTCFIGLNNVSAETSLDSSVVVRPGTIKLDGLNWRTNDFRTYTGGNLTVDYVGNIYFNKNQPIWSSPFYLRYAMCVDGSLSSGWSNNSNASDLVMTQTSIRCNYYGTSYDKGRVAFWTMNISPQNVSSSSDSGTYFSIDHNISSSILSPSSIGLLSIDYSMTPFPIYNETDTLIKQNDTIINKLDTLTGVNGDILYYVKKLYENTITCRDSYNLFDISKVQSRTSLIVNDDGTITLTSEYNNRTANTLKDFAPDLKVGKAYILSFDTTSNYKRIYLDVSKTYWDIGKSVVITEDMLNSYVYFFGVPDGNTIIDKIQIQSGTKSTTWEPYGEQICKSKVDETNDAINESNKKLDETNNKLQQQQDFINNDDTSQSSSEAESFFEGFSTNTYGLTSIITAPLELIGNVAGSTCSPLPLQIPFVGGTFNLPCMSSIYKKHFGSFLTVYQTITFGIVAYWVCIRIFALVKDFKNPEHDEIEVMDL